MQTSAHTKRWTGHHVAGAFVLFFGVIISVNFAMAFLAGNSWTGLIAKNGYVASQDFNTSRAAFVAQKATGISSNLSVRETDLLLQVRDAGNNPVPLALAKISIGRPVTEADDFAIEFGAQPLGKLTIPATFANGIWDLHIVAETSSGMPYRRTIKLVARDGNIEVLQ